VAHSRLRPIRRSASTEEPLAIVATLFQIGHCSDVVIVPM
jgi:hypothetical protein